MKDYEKTDLAIIIMLAIMLVVTVLYVIRGYQ